MALRSQRKMTLPILIATTSFLYSFDPTSLCQPILLLLQQTGNYIGSLLDKILSFSTEGPFKYYFLLLLFDLVDSGNKRGF